MKKTKAKKIITSTTCSCCGKGLEETEDKYIVCSMCNRYTPKGANKETRKY